MNCLKEKRSTVGKNAVGSNLGRQAFSWVASQESSTTKEIIYIWTKLQRESEKGKANESGRGDSFPVTDLPAKNKRVALANEQEEN